MNADTLTVVRFAGAAVAFLSLTGIALYLNYRVAKWVGAAYPRGERRLVRGVLGFLCGHGLNLTTGGFSFALVLYGFRDDLPARDRADFLRCMWACFAVGPALAVAAWASLRYIHRGRSTRCV